MRLSGELFQEIIAQLVSDDSATSSNKRREPRVGVRAHGMVSPWTLDDSGVRQTKITIRDLSPGGICVMTNAKMSVGMRFILELPRFQREALMAHYEVRYSKMLTKTLFSIGGKLVNLTDSKMAPAA